MSKKNIMEINQPSPKFQDVSIAPMHTCEHIVNRTMVNLFNCGRAISAHIEKKKSKLDFNLGARTITDEDIRKIEETVNNIIKQNLDVTTEFITQEEASSKQIVWQLFLDAKPIMAFLVLFIETIVPFSSSGLPNILAISIAAVVFPLLEVLQKLKTRHPKSI